jgi:hypothetical protein
MSDMKTETELELRILWKLMDLVFGIICFAIIIVFLFTTFHIHLCIQ